MKEVDFNFYNLKNYNQNVYVNWYIPKNKFMKLVHALSMGNYYDGKYKSFPKGTNKILSSTYEYVMKPWEFWILIK